MTQWKIPWAARIFILVLSLLGAIYPFSPSEAADEAKWRKVNRPTEGEVGNWTLASGADIQYPTLARDGALYVYANPSGSNYRLFKSTDNGTSWSATGKVTGAIVALAMVADNASMVYYATAASVYKSADAGNSFTQLPPNPGGAGSNNIAITALAITQLAGKNIIVIGTRDTDNSQFGGVYIWDENEILPSWQNTNMGNYDVLAVAFSPNFASDRQLIAVVTDEKDTLVTSRISKADWGKAIGNAKITNLVAQKATIAFPQDYNANREDYTLFVALDSGSNQGDVFRVEGRRAPNNSAVADLNIGSAYGLSGVDVSGLAVSGQTSAANLFAGAASGTQVYISNDGGGNWQRSEKEPSGQSKTFILLAPDFPTSSLAYAATSGSESAFSVSRDSGMTWNQTGLIDTAISEIIDLAVSAGYERDNTLFLLTFNGTNLKHSLWRSQNSGARWERVFSSSLANAGSLKLVELSPQYEKSGVVFLAGTSGGSPVIWKSSNNGRSFIRQSAPLPIDTWRVVNDNSLFLGSYDGSQGLVYYSSDNGFFYSEGIEVGQYPLKSIAISPNYEQDKTILIGNTNGWVYYSQDNGTTFTPLPPKAASPPLSGEITVAFDPEFKSNKTVYALSNTKVTANSKERIYRFIIGRSESWESIHSNLPLNSTLSQLAISSDGNLYTTNSQLVDAEKKEGGMERSLNPTYSLNPTFETVTRGLDNGATLTGLWLQGNQLWSVDSKNTQLMTFMDSLTLPVSLTSPLDRAPGTNTRNISLEWKGLTGATEYQWQLSYDGNFASIPAGFEGNTQTSSARLPSLEVATTYYWRVRASKPMLSPWSAKWSFTTSLGATVVTPELYSPKAGASEVPLRPIFQWSALAGADSYELLVATDVSFANPVIVKAGDYALPATAWQSNINLEHETTYYWKIRAKSANSYSAWSSVSAFITEAPPIKSLPAAEPSLPTTPPQLTVPSPPPSSPSPPTQPAFPNWIIYTFGALLIIVILLLITLLVTVISRR